MVSELHKRQLVRFTRKLIEIRFLTEGFGSFIVFNLTDVPNNAVLEFTPDKPFKEHTEWMLTEIKDFLVRNKGVVSGDLSWTVEGPNKIKILGFATDYLKSYLMGKWGESYSAFGEEENEERKPVLTYNGVATAVILSKGNELAVFRCLLNKAGQTVTFQDLVESIRKRRTFLDRATSREETRPAREKEKTAVRSAIGVLEEKLKRATFPTVFPEIIKSDYGRGYKLVL